LSPEKGIIMIEVYMEAMEVEMPETEAPGMVRVEFRIPAPLYEDFLQLAELEGWKPAELHRILWEKGFAVHAEGSNKRLVNRQLRQRFLESDRSPNP
jgi:hypothetical protein